MVTDPQSVADLDGCVADGRGGYEDLARAIMDGGPASRSAPDSSC